MADGPKYRIWLNRSDTHGRITDENIWVGNVPNDGFSKISSGLTSGANYAYVEFNTWEDLLKAIGDSQETVEVLVTGQFEQVDNGGGGGGETTISLTVSGTFTQEMSESGGGDDDNPDIDPDYDPEPGDDPVTPDNDRLIDYDLQKGNMLVYDDGTYTIGSDESGTLFDNLTYTEGMTLELNSNSYPFDNVEASDIPLGAPKKKSALKAGNPSGRHYAVVPNTDFESPGNYPTFVNKPGETGQEHSTVVVYDSEITVTFNITGFTIDRSLDKSFRNQLPSGVSLYDYVTIQRGGNAILDYDIRKVHFFIGHYYAGQSVYRGDAVSIICAGSGWSSWEFDDCTWLKDGTTTISVAYGTKVLEAQGELTVTMVDSNPNKIYVRRTSTPNHRCVAGREYSFDYFIKFLPEDAKFSDFLLSNFSLSSNNTNVLQVVDNGTTPTNWNELYNSKKVISIASGSARLRCTWKGSTTSGGYTDPLVSVTNS